MNSRTRFVFALCVAVALVGVCRGDVKIEIERIAEGGAFKFSSVPAPAVNDAAANAEFKLVDGTADRNSGPLSVCHDGRLPANEDAPAENFFFAAGSQGGRVRIDLQRVIPVKQIATYSWHVSSRAPQVYSLYAADGTAAEFQLDPKPGIDPTTCGWKTVARVDSRSKGTGGQQGVAISDSSGTLGSFRHLLFEILRTEDRDAFGNTFFSEIDVVDANGPHLVSIPLVETQAILKSFEAEDGKYHFTIDATKAPDLLEWSEKSLAPVVQAWYPKIVALLPSDRYEPPTKIRLLYRNDMGGIPASASGSGINLNARWFRGELKREALGAVVHELVHVVQGYRQAYRSRGSRPPSWLVEGIADYIRWFLYEPQSQGAEVTRLNLAQARYDASYRITGNFLNWVSNQYDKEIVRKLNAAAREGRYDEKLWKEATGKSLEELGAQWKAFHEQKLAAEKAAAEEKG